MARFSLNDLITPLTKEQVQASIYRVLGALGVNTTSWKTGAVVRTQIVASSIILAALSQLQANIARSGFLEFSTGDWLTLLARYVYGVERNTATFAAGLVTLTNTGGGVYAFDPGDLIVLDARTGKSYRNSGSISLSAMTTLANVEVVATEAGSASNAAAGEISQLQTTLLNVGVTNPAGVVGADDETDPELRIRCYEQLGALSPMGPWDAYGAAVRSAKRADGSSLGITRTRIKKDGFGGVTTYIANNSGAVGSDDVAIADEACHQFAAPLGVNPTTVSANEVDVDVAYELWMYNTSGNTPDQVAALERSALLAFFSVQPISGNIIDGVAPGKLFQDAIRSTIANALADQIYHVVVTAPAGDVSLSIGDVAALGTITAIIHQTPPPEGFSP